jgi:putative acetyltransferase
MLIRPEQPADTDAIYAIHATSFPAPLEARLVDALRDAGRLLVSLVAEYQGMIVGHVAFSPVTAEGAAIGAGLGPVAVFASHRRHGIAAELIKRGLADCKTAGFGWAVVLGDPAYYGRFGFRAAAEFGLSDEYGGGQHFQVLELSPGAMPVGAGLVQYAPEFAATA